MLAACWEELFPLRAPRLELALALAPAGSRTLDAGCATGSLPRALAVQGRRAHGLDLEPAFLAEARRLARVEGRAVVWHQAGLLELARTAGEARFALVTCLGQTLPHLLEEAEWSDFFAQARAVLEPGGRLVIQVVNDGEAPAGTRRDLPLLEVPAGTLERRRILVSDTLARFETVFRPAEGPALRSEVRHRRMAPERAAALLRGAGLEPEPPLADEGGRAFGPASPGWILAARRS
jgi:SAM-dependent methyltransferase